MAEERKIDPEQNQATPSGDMNENDLYELLDRMENNVLQAKQIPFSNNCMIEREEMLIMIGMLRDNLPVEIKQAKWLLEQNRQLIAESRREADQIIRQAENRMSAMLDEHEITKQAREYAEQTVEQAKGSADKIREGAIKYAEKRLADVEEQLTSVLVQIQKNRSELQD